MSFYDYQNLRFLLQVFKREGQDTSVLVLVDGDSAGKGIGQRVSELCRRLSVQLIKLGEGRSVEDYCLFDDQFLAAVKKALQNACEAEGKNAPRDLEERIRKSWEEHTSIKEKSEKRGKATEKTDEVDDNRKERVTTGRWFKKMSHEILEDEASKVVVARSYAELCRESGDRKPNRERLKEAKVLSQDVITKLGVVPIRAERSVETTANR